MVPTELDGEASRTQIGIFADKWFSWLTLSN
jgi:hypothetical protein